MHKYLIRLTLFLLLTACKAQDVQPEVPALLTNPGDAMLLQLEQTLSEAMGGTKVTLTADVFTKTSVLVLERGLRRGIEGNAELGRDLGRPYRFQLLTNGSNCVVLDPQTGMHWPLAGAVCRTE